MTILPAALQALFDNLSAQELDKLASSPSTMALLKEVLVADKSVSNTYVTESQLGLHFTLKAQDASNPDAEDDGYKVVEALIEKMQQAVRGNPLWTFTDHEGITCEPYEFCEADGTYDFKGEPAYAVWLHHAGSTGFGEPIRALMEELVTRLGPEVADDHGLTFSFAGTELYQKHAVSTRQVLDEAPAH